MAAPVEPAVPGQEVRRSLAYLVPVVASNALPFITLPIFTRILAPADYGYLALATAYASVVTGLTQLGLAGGFDREFMARERAEGAGLLYASLAFVLAGVLAVALGTWAFGDTISRVAVRSADHAPLLVVTLAAVGTQAMRQYMLMFFRNSNDSGSFARYSVIEAVLWAALGLAFVAGLRTGVIGIPLGQAIGTGVVMLLMLARIRGLGPAPVNWAALSAALRVGMPLTPRVLVSVVSQQFDKYMLGLLGTPAAVGIYAVAQRLSYVVFTYMTALENAYVPRTMRMMFADGDEGGANIGRYLTPFAYFSAAAGVGIIVLAEEVLRVFVPPEYWAAEPVIVLLALYYVATFFAKQKQLLFTKRAHLLSVLSVVGLGLNVALNIPLIRWLGALGAALGTALAGILTVWVTVAVSQRHYRIRYEATKVAAIMAAPGVACAMVLLLRYSDVSYPWRALAKLALVAAFLGLGWRLGYLNRKHLKNLISVSPKVPPVPSATP